MQQDLSPEIDRLYERLSDLIARQADDPSLDADVARLRARLQELQAREAEAMQAWVVENRILDPSRAWKALEEADRVLSSEDPATWHRRRRFLDDIERDVARQARPTTAEEVDAWIRETRNRPI